MTGRGLLATGLRLVAVLLLVEGLRGLVWTAWMAFETAGGSPDSGIWLWIGAALIQGALGLLLWRQAFRVARWLRRRGRWDGPTGRSRVHAENVETFAWAAVAAIALLSGLRMLLGAALQQSSPTSVVALEGAGFLLLALVGGLGPRRILRRIRGLPEPPPREEPRPITRGALEGAARFGLGAFLGAEAIVRGAVLPFAEHSSDRFALLSAWVLVPAAAAVLLVVPAISDRQRLRPPLWLASRFVALVLLLRTVPDAARFTHDLIAGGSERATAGVLRVDALPPIGVIPLAVRVVAATALLLGAERAARRQRRQQAMVSVVFH